MERMWRKVNHSLRNTNKSQQPQQPPGGEAGATAGGATAAATPQSTDTISSAGGFGDGQLVVAVQGLAAAGGGSNATGRRLASSGGGCNKSLSQHVLQTRTASSERRRRRRRKSRPRRGGGMGVTSCVGDTGGDNMSSSGGFYTLKEHQHYRPSHHHGGGVSGGGGGSSRRLFATSAPSGTVMMYPNPQRATPLAPSTGGGGGSGPGQASTSGGAAGGAGSGGGAGTGGQPDISLRQRAVAKLRMFNFHLNWDLHMTHCKPCGPRLSGSGGNIITRRLCRNRRREDNELYRSNSFKFERFERKECLEELSNTLQKQIAICDDYSLPVDFVKKRPSSFDPCLAEAIPANPEHWIAPSPQTEFLPFGEAQQALQLQAATAAATAATTSAAAAGTAPQLPPPLPAPAATLPSQAATTAAAAAATATAAILANHQQHQHLSISSSNNNNNGSNTHSQQNTHSNNNNTLPVGAQQQHHHQPQRATLQHPPLPNSNIKQASVKLIEGYSDPKDTRNHKKVYHKKAKKRTAPGHKRHQQQHQQQQQQQTLPTPRGSQQQQQQQQLHQRHSTYNNNNGNLRKDKRNSQYNSDSSAPKSSDDEADIDEEVEQQPLPVPQPPAQTAPLTAAGLNSPDSISDDLVRPLPPQLQRSPRKLTVAPVEHNKRQPSPYYYSDLLKSRDKDKDKERDKDREDFKLKCRQSTASEPPQQTPTQLGGYRKSSSLDVPPAEEQQQQQPEAESHEEEDPRTGQDSQSTPKRYSFTEEGVHIIRCETPSTSTSEESDCSECLKRREWHARALALVRKTCNVQPRNQHQNQNQSQNQGQNPTGSELQLQLQHCDAGEGELLKCCPPPPAPAEIQVQVQPMPPHRLLGPAAVCGACITSAPASSSSLAGGRGSEPGDDLEEEYFRPRSIFYVHPHGVHECAECAQPAVQSAVQSAVKSVQSVQSVQTAQPPTLPTLSNPTLDLYGNDEDEVDGDEDEEEDEEEDDDSEDIMGSRRRQIYETAFDCKIAKSDDDLDEVDRITNCSVLLQLSNGNGNGNCNAGDLAKVNSLVGGGAAKTRAECKRAKNSKNQALQEQTGEAHVQVHQVQSELGKLQLSQVDQQNQNQNQGQSGAATGTATATATATATDIAGAPGSGVSASSTQQLPVRGYTPSPPSTAPLPMKFPGKHERYLNMNSIRSAPNLPAANPAHPRLRDLRLPIQSMRNQCGGGGNNSSNDNSLTDSAYVNPPSTNSNSHSNAASGSAAGSAGSDLISATTGSAAAVVSAPRRPRSFVLESGRVLELRRSAQGGHHHHSHQYQHQQQQPGGHHHTVHHHHHHGRRSHHHRQGAGQTVAGGGHNYSSTESIATSSSGGSMESLRSSTSEGNRSTSSSESRHSSSLSSHSSESGGSGGSGGSSSVAYPLRSAAPPQPLLLQHSKLHILSPISDKSSQEPASASASSEQSQQQQSQQQQQQQQQKAPMAMQEEDSSGAPAHAEKNHGGTLQVNPVVVSLKQPRNRAAPNKALLQLADELLGSDSGISLHSREEGKPQTLALQRLTLPKLQLIGASEGTATSSGGSGSGGGAGGGGGGGASSAAGVSGSGSTGTAAGLPQDLRDLPFDMPKLRRRKTLQQEAACTSGSATSVDLGELPFDMPKLRRRLRANQAEINNLLMHSTESSGISQASSSHSMRDDQKLASKLDTALFRQNLTLNLNESRQATKQFGSLDLRGLSSNKELNMNLGQGYVTAVDLIDVTIPLERQGWYHGAITRVEAETTLRPLSEGSFLVRNCESTKQDYSLSLKGAKGFMHMRIQRNETGQYILGQFSRPFETVPEMIRHFCLNRLPVRGAEHMCLIEPVIAQLL
ncbi:uncharacterized protein LOC108137294 [Drosophila elegans]|uniref:uncharacterized protein LOC108137294 n=1 Tax=Drosophila elegans TaxID=30023 RepID=UPI0007E7E573|nr:uncharacterized protein LOC108137294 [Drosophila elegans]